MIQHSKIYVCVLIVALSSVIGSATVAEDAKPDGTVSIEIKAVADGDTFGPCTCKLKLKKENYTFQCKGLSVVDLDNSTISVQGDVYHLKSAMSSSGFSGVYSIVEAGIAVEGGSGALIMKNLNNVVLKLDSQKAGVQLKLAPEGLEVTPRDRSN